MNERYDFKEIELKWQKYWEDNKSFKVYEMCIRDSDNDDAFYI